MFIKKATGDSHHWNIHIAGDIQMAREFTRQYTYQKGWCVQLIQCEYIYTGGLENGMIARVIMYPRFVKEYAVLDREVKEYAVKLANHLCQKSYSIETEKEINYYESDNPLHGK